MAAKSFFKILAKLNKVVMPKFSQKDFMRLTKLQQAMVAYRYWVTKNSLD